MLPPNHTGKLIAFKIIMYRYVLYFFRAKICQALVQLFKKAMNFENTLEACWDWLFVLPLYHFLSGYCEPFAPLGSKKPQFDCCATKLGYKDLQKKLIPG